MRVRYVEAARTQGGRSNQSHLKLGRCHTKWRVTVGQLQLCKGGIENGW